MIKTVSLAEPGPGEVLVRIVAAGVCRSDLSAVAGARARPTPVVAGHEAVGVIEALGEGVRDLRVDDHVVLVFVAGCGACRTCRAGRPNLCDRSWQARAEGTLLTGARRLSHEGVALHHWSGVSAFAEHAVVAAASAVRIDPDIPLIDAASVGCAVLTGVGAVLTTAGVRPGQSVAVIGLGGVGLSAIMGAAVAGAVEIVGIDMVADRLELARELGATHTINATARPDVADAVREAVGGVDVAFDMAGAADTVASAYAMTRRGGAVVLAGLPSPCTTFAVPVAEHVADEKRLLGSYMGSATPHRDVGVIMALYRAGRLPLHRLRSAALPLDEINTGLDRLHEGVAVRDVVEPAR